MKGKFSGFFWASVFVLAAAFAAYRFGPVRPWQERSLARETAEAALDLRAQYEKHFPDLNPSKRAHFSMRLYRITGEDRYRQGVLDHGREMLAEFHEAVSRIKDAGLRENLEGESAVPDAEKSPKQVMRRKVLEKHKPVHLGSRLLRMAYSLESLGLHTGENKPVFDQALDYLEGIPFRDFLFDPEVIRYQTSRAVNAVYYLRSLGIRDWTREFEERFREVFPDQEDSLLPKTEYLNKIYGLTHFIIAASDYYQAFVPAGDYEWILHYFSRNLDAILLRTTPDVIAEIAVCFKLCGLHGDPAVEKIQRYLLEHLKKNRGAMRRPAPAPGFWNRNEHRTTVAILALTEFSRLYPGPDLGALPGGLPPAFPPAP